MTSITAHLLLGHFELNQTLYVKFCITSVQMALIVQSHPIALTETDYRLTLKHSGKMHTASSKLLPDELNNQ
ncbi:hypothetical protein ACTXT7_004139 [Hymenolepis weldensis]